MTHPLTPREKVVHSAASGSIPRQPDLSVIAELQALAFRIVGLENLDSVVTRKRDEAAGGVNQKGAEA